MNIPNVPREGDPPTAKSLSASAPVSKGPGGRKQRGGRKPAAAVPEAIVSVDGEEGMLFYQDRHSRDSFTYISRPTCETSG